MTLAKTTNSVDGGSAWRYQFGTVTLDWLQPEILMVANDGGYRDY